MRQVAASTVLGPLLGWCWALLHTRTSAHAGVYEVKGLREEGHDVLLRHVVHRQLQVLEVLGVAGLQLKAHLHMWQQGQGQEGQA